LTEVQPQGKDNENAKLTVQFDQAELKGGPTLQIVTVLQSVSAAESSDLRADSMSMSAPLSAGATSPMGSNSTGGSPGGQPRTSTGSMAPSTQTSAPGASSSGATNIGGPAAGTVVARQGNVAIKTTSIPGVLIGTTANGQPFSNAAGVLLGAKRNVHLDGGTHIVLAVAVADAKPGVGQ
jgi:hypothetical protein